MGQGVSRAASAHFPKGNCDCSAIRPYHISPKIRFPRQTPYFIWHSTGRRSGRYQAAGGNGDGGQTWPGLPHASPCTAFPATSGLFLGPEACLTFSSGDRALDAESRVRCDSKAMARGRWEVAAGPPRGLRRLWLRNPEAPAALRPLQPGAGPREERGA